MKTISKSFKKKLKMLFQKNEKLQKKNQKKFQEISKNAKNENYIFFGKIQKGGKVWKSAENFGKVWQVWQEWQVWEHWKI